MTNHTFSSVIPHVVSGELSVTKAAKMLGMSEPTLRRRLQTNPDYVKAKADGKLRAPVADTTPVDIEAIKTNPAVLAVVEGGMTLQEAFDTHPGVVGSVPTLNRWVNAAYPEHRNREGAHKGGRKSVAEQTAPFIDVLLGYVRDTASTLDLPPEKLIKLMSKRLEEAAR